MINGNDFTRAAELVSGADSACICLPVNPGFDTLASGLALYLGLIKQGKNVSIACAGDLPVDSLLTGLDKIQKTLSSGGDNLVISFPYRDGAIDKVTYNIEGNKFNLLIVPKTTNDRLDPSQIKYNYTGGRVGVIIALDLISLDGLGGLYSENTEQFKGVEIINIDRHLENTNFGTVNLVEKQISSTAELVCRLLQSLNIEVDAEMATNLYAGILNATNQFASYSVNDSTFEVCAFLLKHGAVKKSLNSQTKSPEPIQMSQPVNKPVQADQISGSSQFIIEDTDTQLEPTQSEKSTQIEAKKIEQKEFKEETPKDWLKPKIFKGRNLL